MIRLFAVMLLTLFLASNISANEFIELGDKYSETSDWPLAIEAYEQAVKAEPESSIAESRLGGALLASQRYSDSIIHFQSAISKESTNHGAFIGMAISYLHMGQYKLSRAALMEARKLAVDKAEDIDKMLAWIDSRTAADTTMAVH